MIESLLEKLLPNKIPGNASAAAFSGRFMNHCLWSSSRVCFWKTPSLQFVLFSLRRD